MSIPTGYYTDLTKNYFGIDPASTNQDEVETAALLWNEFLSKVPSEESPYFYVIGGTDETKIKDSILSIISSYISSSGLSQETINQYAADLSHELATRRNTTDIANLLSTNSSQVTALFSSLLSPYVSPLPNIFVSLAEELAIMNADQQKQKIYLDFLSQKLQTTYESSAINSLSPTEIQNRQLTYTLFEILITLINLVSTSQTLSATAENCLVNKEQNYVALLKRSFQYIGSGYIIDTSSSEDKLYTRTAPNADPTLFNLGYGDITVQDIFDYLAEKTLSSVRPLQDPKTPDVPPPDFDTASFVLSSYKDDSPQSICIMAVKKNFATNTISIETKFNHGDNTTSSQQEFPFSVFDLEPIKLTQEITNALSTTFYDVYNRAKAAGFVERGDSLDDRQHNLMIPWGAFQASSLYGSRIGAGGGESDNEKYTSSSSMRQSKNKTLNTYVQNILSKKDITSDTRDSQSQTVDACSSSKEQLLNLLQAIIRQLKSIISSIYK